MRVAEVWICIACGARVHPLEMHTLAHCARRLRELEMQSERRAA